MMTIQEYERCKTLLSEDQLSNLDLIQVGKWIVVNEDGVAGVYERKADAISDIASKHLQEPTGCKSYRHGVGSYSLCIPDPAEDPAEKVYITYGLEKVTPRTLYRFQTRMLSALLPDWYYNPYSPEYKNWNEEMR